MLITRMRLHLGSHFLFWFKSISVTGAIFPAAPWVNGAMLTVAPSQDASSWVVEVSFNDAVPDLANAAGKLPDNFIFPAVEKGARSFVQSDCSSACLYV